MDGDDEIEGEDIVSAEDFIGLDPTDGTQFWGLVLDLVPSAFGPLLELLGNLELDSFRPASKTAKMCVYRSVRAISIILLEIYTHSSQSPNDVLVSLGYSRNEADSELILSALKEQGLITDDSNLEYAYFDVAIIEALSNRTDDSQYYMPVDSPAVLKQLHGEFSTIGVLSKRLGNLPEHAPRHLGFARHSSHVRKRTRLQDGLYFATSVANEALLEAYEVLQKWDSRAAALTRFYLVDSADSENEAHNFDPSPSGKTRSWDEAIAERYRQAIADVDYTMELRAGRRRNGRDAHPRRFDPFAPTSRVPSWLNKLLVGRDKIQRPTRPSAAAAFGRGVSGTSRSLNEVYNALGPPPDAAGKGSPAAPHSPAGVS
jgi:hypothetical protein